MELLSLAISGAILGALFIANASKQDRLVRAVVVAVAALILVPSSAGSEISLGTLAPGYAAAGYASVLGVLSAGRRLRPTASWWLLLVFVGTAAAATLARATSTDSTSLISACLLLLVTLPISLLTRAEVQRVLRGVVVVASVVAVVLIAENLMDTPFFASIRFYQANPMMNELRAQATLAHPLVAGFVLTAAIAAILTLRISAPVAVTASILLLVGTVATGSSSTVAVALLLTTCVVLRYLRRAGRVILVPIVVAAVIIAIDKDVFGATLTDLSPEYNKHRLNSLAAVPNLVTLRPHLEVIFGSGYGSTVDLYNSNIFINDLFYTVDNQFVSALSVGGIVGFIALSLLMLRPIFRKGIPLETRLAALGIVVLAVSFDFIFWPVCAALFVLIAQEAETAIRDLGARKNETPQPARVAAYARIR